MDREIQQPQPSTQSFISRRRGRAGRGCGGRHNQSLHVIPQQPHHLLMPKRQWRNQQQDSQPVQMNLQHQDKTKIVKMANNLHCHSNAGEWHGRNLHQNLLNQPPPHN